MNTTKCAIKIAIALCCAALAAAQPAHAQGTVEPAAPNAAFDEARCFATPDDGVTVFATIDSSAVQSATLAAPAGGTVKVAGYCAGTHGPARAVVSYNNVLTLAGGYTSSNWSTYAPALNPTTLDALSLGRGIDVSASEATLLGLSVTNGNISEGGGAGIRASGALTMADMMVYSNTSGAGGFSPAAADGIGGGTYVVGRALVKSSQFLSNTADIDGGGAWFGGGTIVTGSRFWANYGGNRGAVHGNGGGAFFAGTANIDATLFGNNTVAGRNGAGAYFGGAAVVNGSEFSQNRIENSFGNGAGAYFMEEAMIATTHFMTNITRYDGGGAYFNKMAGITGSLFMSNSGSFGGGARFDTTAWLTRTSFFGNVGDVGGGALLAGEANTGVYGSIFQGNRARIHGAAIAIFGESTLAHNRFEGNACNPCSSAGGGAISAHGILTITASHIVGNSSGGRGGGMLFGLRDTDTGGQLLLENNLFARNVSLLGGVALHVGSPSQTVLLHNTIANPFTGTHQNQSGAPAVSVLSGTMTLTNTVFQHFATGIQSLGANVAHDYTLSHAVLTLTTGSASPGVHQFTGAPGFAAELADDYRLTRHSPARNVGAAVGIATDFEGERRDNQPDLGFDEFVFRTALPAVRR